MPEFIDPRFRENKHKTLVFSHRNERFGLVFAKTGSIISSTALYLLYKRAVWQKFSTPGISELSVQNVRDSGEMLSIDRSKTTSGFFVIPILSQL